MSHYIDQKRTGSKPLLSAAILLQKDKINKVPRDRELSEKVEELAKTSLELCQRFADPSQDQTDTPQLTRKWHELAQAIRSLSH